LALADTLLQAFSFVNPRPKIRPQIGDNGGEEGFRWREAVLDALIIAGLNFFSSLSAMSATQIARNPWVAILTALIAAGFGFFSTLAIKRGLKRG